MGETPPVVYVLHGEDEYGITQFVSSIVDKLGDPAMAGMNTARLDGRSTSVEELETAAKTLPFLGSRRIVIVTNPLARLTSPTARNRFKSILDQVPAPVALVLVEYKLLTLEKDRKKENYHWLEKWAQQAGPRVLARAFPLPAGGAMVRRVQDLAKAAGGQITPSAAELLSTLVGDSPRLADQEIQKLLAYVNYCRPIEPEDVEHLTADQGHGDIFALVDAIGNRDGKQSVNMLHRLLSEQDAISIFGMVVRQFRLLILAREFADEGGQKKDAAQVLKLHPFVADKVLMQARRFTLPDLEAIYRRLLELDDGMKRGEMEGTLALDMLIAGITQPPVHSSR
jgi:DNA polymerase III subunit delta